MKHQDKELCWWIGVTFLICVFYAGAGLFGNWTKEQKPVTQAQIREIKEMARQCPDLIPYIEAACKSDDVFTFGEFEHLKTRRDELEFNPNWLEDIKTAKESK